MPLAVEQGTDIPLRAEALTAAAQTHDVLGITYVPQYPYSQLCWAACAAMVFGWAKFKAHDWPLCAVPSEIMKTNVCQYTHFPPADHAAAPEYPYQWFHFPFNSTTRALYPVEIKQELSLQRPVQAVFNFSNSIGHTALIVGYSDNGWLHVFDPWIGFGWWQMPEVYAAYGMGGSWQSSLGAFGVTNAAVA